MNEVVIVTLTEVSDAQAASSELERPVRQGAITVLQEP